MDNASANYLLLKLAAGLLALLLLLFALLRLIVLPWVDADLNRVIDTGPYRLQPAALEFHRRLFVADMHSDALLWGRDLRRRYDRGQLDLPRLRDGGIDLQVLSAVTQVPAASAPGVYAADSDRLPLLFAAAWRPPSSWFSAHQRALQQARELELLAREPGFRQVLRRADLESGGIKLLLALEGMHALEAEPAKLQTLYAAGYRMMGLVHFSDNAVAGSTFGVEQHGLTAFGRGLIPRLEALGVTVDLAHASPAAFADTIAIARKPVVVSHGGVSGTCPGARNLSDAQLRALAQNGGVIGIGFWNTAVCDTRLEAIVDAIRHAIAVAGIDHVGLGSDFDGAVTTPFDSSALPLLSAALLDAGLSQREVAAVMGENLRRVLRANLPE